MKRSIPSPAGLIVCRLSEAGRRGTPAMVLRLEPSARFHKRSDRVPQPIKTSLFLVMDCSPQLGTCCRDLAPLGVPRSKHQTVHEQRQLHSPIFGPGPCDLQGHLLTIHLVQKCKKCKSEPRQGCLTSLLITLRDRGSIRTRSALCKVVWGPEGSPDLAGHPPHARR